MTATIWQQFGDKYTYNFVVRQDILYIKVSVYKPFHWNLIKVRITKT